MGELVYIAALAPDEVETVVDVFYRTPPRPEALTPAPDRNGPIWLPPEASGAGIRAERLGVGADRARGRATADRTGVHHRPVSRPLWRDRPSLVAEDDRMIPSVTQRFTAEPMGA